MEPRQRIFALSDDLPMDRLIDEVARRGYSRVPIYSESLDHVRGILYAKDLVVHSFAQPDAQSAVEPRLGDLLHTPLFVPDHLPAEDLLRRFKQNKIHLALVVDERDTLIGLVTMEDLLEEMFGEIYDEREQQKAARRSAQRSAQATPRSVQVVAAAGRPGSEPTDRRADDSADGGGRQ
ncbi:MAG: CBS domain-containing protein, partial [Myxococcota bacterium]